MTNPWYIPFVSVSGALIVAILNYLLQKSRDQAERIAKFTDNICKEINDTANVGTLYWISDSLSDTKDRKVLSELVRLEHELVGRQSRISALFQSLRELDKRLKLVEAQPDFDTFITQLTGGEFRVSNRKANLATAALIQHTAATLNGRLYRAVGIRAKAWR